MGTGWSDGTWTGQASTGVIVMAIRHTAVAIEAPLTQRMMEKKIKQEANRREGQRETKQEKLEPGEAHRCQHFTGVEYLTS